jgi:tetratricopeptide (TPR) repeat protein
VSGDGPKVVVYAIARDEQENVAAWADSALEADLVTLVDTGSTDDTVRLAGKARVNIERVVIDPWRFDDARNAALAMQPAWADICVSLDLDERLQPGWRAALEAAWAAGVNRPLYRYVWNFTPDGSPGIVFLRDHAHPRRGYRWRHPVHEVVEPVAGTLEVRGEAVGMEVHHYGDAAKDRTNYLPLLELAVAEDPDDDRNMHYLGREYLFRGAWDRAEDTLRRHLELPRARWAPERAASMRMLGETVWLRRWNLPDGPEEAEGWYLRAAAEAPDYRENWLALAQHYQRTDRPALAMTVATRGCEVTERRLDYITTAAAWDGTLERLAGIYTVELDQEPAGNHQDSTSEVTTSASDSG